jgi:hypothetical protein
MKNLSAHQRKIIRITGTIILALLFVVVLIWFIASTKQLYVSGELRTDYPLGNHSTYLHQPASVNYIRTWMTFDYVNVIYKLPADYLENTLAVSDPRYPNVRIDYYIRRHDLNPSLFLQSIQQAITNYPGTLPAEVSK